MTDDQRVAELLAELRTRLGRYPAVTQITIDEYQLRFATSEFGVTAESGWVLTSPGGKTEQLDADFRRRAVGSYAICRVLGHDIVSVDFDAAGSLVVGFETGDILAVPMRNDGYESYSVSLGADSKSLGIYFF